MKRWWLVPAGVLGVATAVAMVWLVRDDLRLRDELAAARAAAASAGAVEPTGPVAERPPAAAPTGRRGGNPLGLLGGLGRGLQDRPAPRADDAAGRDAGPPDWEGRRAERQQRMRDLLGRQPGESEEAYRDRVAPMVKTLLTIPRDRMAERRRQFEEAAGVSAEQKAKLDAAFQEASAEVVELANAAVKSGDLTPYNRNSRGVLAFVGSTVGTVDALDGTLRQVLTPEQQAIMEESGFDPLEYLGVTSPWESMQPPPPPPTPGM